QVNANENISTIYSNSECIAVLNENASQNEDLFLKNLAFDTRIKAINKLTKNHNKNEDKCYNSILKITLQSNSSEIMTEFVKDLNDKEEILVSCPDYKVEISETSCNDVKFLEQQEIHNLIGLPKAWDITTGSSSVIVGVLDTGIDGSHSDLKQQIDNSLSRDFTYGDCRTVSIAEDYKNHGTHVSGILGAKGNNSNGIAGVCWDVTLVSLAVLEGGIGDISNVIRGINYAEEQKIPLLNISLKCYQGWYGDVDVSAVYTAALKNYSGLAICAAGNENLDNDGDNPSFPGSVKLDNVISVGNSDVNDMKYSSSNYGKESVDLFAPGVNVYSTLPGNKYGYLTGTSMATPFVTGVAALLLSKYPNMTPSELKASILMNVDKVSSLSKYCVTGGRLNAYNALSNPHFHNYQYHSLDLLHHEYQCSCGMPSQIEKHHFKNNVCIECNLSHTHSFSMTYRDNKTHINTCLCGATTGQAGSHAVSQTDAYDGDNKATCVGCGALLDLSRDMALILPFSNRGTKKSANGSLILPSGIIVLVDEDLEAYFNGSLLFNDSDIFLN
ncbi:S8 family serine peptidase, partial [bacterium]|nr:S8 family serine peptidase [bacterium]